MLRHLLSHIPRPGTRPGHLGSDTDVEARRVLPLTVYRIDYAGGMESREAIYKDAGPALAEPPRENGVSWWHFEGEPTPSLLTKIRDDFGLHPLAVEDVLHRGQRPKLETYDDYIFAVLLRPVHTDAGLAFEQVSLFMGEGFVLSFHGGAEDIFAPVRQRVKEGKGRIAEPDPDYLSYCLADVVVDHGFPVLEAYAENLETIEEGIFTDDRSDPVPAIHAARRDLIGMRKVQWRHIAMLAEWIRTRAEHDLLSEDNTPYFRDAEDHAQRVGDLLESYLDTTGSLLDAHLSLSSAKLNQVMKMLTLIATIFMPLTFVAGIYGMNFDPEASPWNMPELSAYYGYPITLLAMALMGVVMYLYFRFRHWL